MSTLQLPMDLTPRPKQFITTPTGQKLFLAGKLWMPYALVGEENTQRPATGDVLELNKMWCLTDYNPWLDRVNYVVDDAEGLV